MEPEKQENTPLFGKLVAQWSVVTAVASFAVYVLGYLALRFQLTALGIGTDLELLDERYLFEGAKFLVYLISTIPLVVLVMLPFAVCGWLLSRSRSSLRMRLAQYWANPAIPLLVGVIAAVLIIQLVMRQCFAFDNLLLRDTLPEPAWFSYLLVAPSDVPAQLYFAFVIVGIAGVAGLGLAFRSWQAAPLALRALATLLFCLLGIKVLLLPVNYGILMSGRTMPRLAPNPELGLTASGATAWLIWEGKTGVTFLVREGSTTRKLLTLPRDKVTRVEIVAYDTLPALRSPARDDDRVAVVWPWKKLAVAFVGPSPRAQRSRAVVRGNIYVVSGRGGKAEPLTQSGDFHSPLFLAGDNSLIALQGERLVRIDLKGGDPQELAALSGASRLIGTNPANPSVIFLLANAKGQTRCLRFDLVSKQLGVSTDPPAGDEDESMLNCLYGDDRERDNVRLIVKEKDPRAFWTDIFLQRGGEPEVNLTQGDGVSSRQPAFSNDGRLVAFVRMDDSR